jgi:hypothetical protein
MEVCSASDPGRFIPGEKCVAVAKVLIPSFAFQESNPGGLKFCMVIEFRKCAIVEAVVF